MKIREKWLGFLLIPFINTVNYYLTYSSMALTSYFLLTYSIDTVQGWIVWYAGRAVVLKLDAWYPYGRGVVRRILLQIALTLFVMLFLIIIMTEAVNALWGDGPLPLSFYTENLVIFFIWILVFNGIYTGIHFYRQTGLSPPAAPTRIAVRLGKQKLLLEESDILFFQSEGDLITMVDRKLRTFYLDQSLRQLEGKLTDRFFRANRQYLLSRESVRRYQPGINGKLQVWIPKGGEGEEEITVSRTKAAAFRRWLG